MDIQFAEALLLLWYHALWQQVHQEHPRDVPHPFFSSDDWIEVLDLEDHHHHQDESIIGPYTIHEMEYIIQCPLGKGTCKTCYLATPNSTLKFVFVDQMLRYDQSIFYLNRLLAEGMVSFALPSSPFLERFRGWSIVSTEPATLVFVTEAVTVPRRVFHQATGIRASHDDVSLSLAQLVARRGCIPKLWVERWAPSVLKGLHVLHASGIVHGDIKPANILLRYAGDTSHIDLVSLIPVICDFGSSWFCMYHPPEPSGTLGFSAPEVLQGEGVAASDVWSIGIMVFFFADRSDAVGRWTQPMRLFLVGTRRKAAARHRRRGPLLALIYS